MNKRITRREVMDAFIWSFAAGILVLAILYAFGWFGTVPA